MQNETVTSVSHATRNQSPQEQTSKALAGRDSDEALERQVSSLKQQVRQVSLERDRVQAESAILEQQLAQLKAGAEGGEQALSEKTNEVEKVRNDQAQLVAALVEKETKITELTDELTAQATAVQRERELNTAAKDVRTLMGARNMHMIDVYDFDTRGPRDKSFCRVFYTGASLVFYAFDLGEKGSSSKVTVQAWGQREGRGTGPKNLGVCHVEEHLQKRWVL